MKNILKTLALIVMSTAMIGFASCEKNTDDTPAYAIHYNGAAMAADATIDIQPNLIETQNDFASIDLLLENKTSDNLSTCIKVEMLEGPDAMKDLMICYGTTCKNPTCPWTSDAFTLTPGVNENMAIKFDYAPSKVTTKTVYRMTVGKAGSLDNSQTLLISITA